MNVVNKLTFRYLKFNKKRTIVTIIGVILSVALITGVTTFLSSLQAVLVQDVIESHGNWHALFQDIDTEKIDIFSGAEKINNVMLVRDLGYASLEGAADPGKPYLFIQEFDENSLANLVLNLREGRLPRRSDELVVAKINWTNAGASLQVGDKLELHVGQRYSQGNSLGQSDPFLDAEVLEPEFTREYTVVGIVSVPASLTPHQLSSAPGYTVISYLDNDRLGVGRINIYVQYADISMGLYRHSRELAASAGTRQRIEYNDDLLAVCGTGNIRMTYVYALLAILIIMLGSVSLISNAFSISISERRRQLGMMASVGATKRQLHNSIIIESVLIGVLGIPLGILAGVGFMGAAFKFVDPLLAEVSSPALFIVTPQSIWAAVLFAAVTIYFSVRSSAWRVAGISPMEVIRQVGEFKFTAKAVQTSWLTKRIFGFETELALKNLKRNRRRYRSTIISLGLSIILFLAITGIITYAMENFRSTNQGINYDLSVQVFDPSKQEEQDVMVRIAALEGVDEYVIEQTLRLSAEIEKDRVSDYFTGNYLTVAVKSLNDAAFSDYARKVGINPDVFASHGAAGIAINLYRGYNQEKKYVETEVIEAMVGDVLQLGRVSSQQFDHIGDVSIAALTSHVPLGTGVWDNSLNTLTVIVPESVFEGLADKIPEGQQYTQSLMYINSPNPERLEEKIKDLNRDMFGNLKVSVYNHALDAKVVKTITTSIWVFSMGFIVMITAICIANIFNTISTSIGLRRREFAMLKSVGMMPEGFNGLIMYESAFYGIKALSFALPVSLGINYFSYRGLSDGDFPFTLPWASYGIAIISVFTIIFATMFYASAQIKKENIIDSLRDENM